MAFWNRGSVPQVWDPQALQDAKGHFLAGRTYRSQRAFRKLADRGCGPAMYLLGLYDQWGIFVPPNDIAKALEWYEKSRQAGDLLGAARVCVLRQTEHVGSAGDLEPEQLFQRVQALAEGGDLFAQYELADMYKYGCGTTADQDQYRHWLHVSADNGLWMAQYQLSFDYELGDPEVTRLCALAAAARCTTAQTRMGLSYIDKKASQNGPTVFRDPEAAFKWFKQAAFNGDTAGRVLLGTCHLFGIGTKPNIREAISNLKEAAEKDDADAQYFLGIAYELQNDQITAMQWYAEAGDQGNTVAHARLVDMHIPYIDPPDPDDAQPDSISSLIKGNIDLPIYPS